VKSQESRNKVAGRCALANGKIQWPASPRRCSYDSTQPVMWFRRGIATPVGRLTVAMDGEGLRSRLVRERKSTTRPGVRRGSVTAPALRGGRASSCSSIFRRREEGLRPVAESESVRRSSSASGTRCARSPSERHGSYGPTSPSRSGHRKAVRAVGAANGRNPLPIVISLPPRDRARRRHDRLRRRGSPSSSFLLVHEGVGPPRNNPRSGFPDYCQPFWRASRAALDPVAHAPAC